MNDFCDLLGTPDAPVSKIAAVNGNISPLAPYAPTGLESSSATEENEDTMVMVMNITGFFCVPKTQHYYAKIYNKDILPL